MSIDEHIFKRGYEIVSTHFFLAHINSKYLCLSQIVTLITEFNYN